MVKKYFPNESKESRRLRKLQEKNKQQKNVVDINYEKVEKVAFVLGNGISRKSIKPIDLKPYGTIYGCNALYREFVPEHLVAVDTKMIKEITSTGYHLKNKVWTNPSRYTREIYGLNLFNPNLGWSSGPSALNLASGHEYSVIYILGFDYVGLGKNNELVNNLYAGTFNYKNVNDRATYFGNWTRQTATCIKKHTMVKYVRVVENATSFIPDVLINLPNLEHITIDNFIKRFNL
jgi:hypothetical protein